MQRLPRRLIKLRRSHLGEELSRSWVNRVDFGLPDECPLYPEERRESRHCWTSRSGHNRKWPASFNELVDGATTDDGIVMRSLSICSLSQTGLVR